MILSAVPDQAALAALAERPGLPPFDARLMDFCRHLHKELHADPAMTGRPELQAFAFWMRPKALERLRLSFLATRPAGAVAVPRGVVFHVPPGNVALVFGYCWLLSLLAGNANIVRLSPSRPPLADALERTVADALADFPDIGQRQLFVSYGHDDALTARLSAASDMRILWGGDATIGHLRKIPLPPAATELAFADRFSLAAFDAASVLALDGARLADLAGRLYDDIFQFDQMACSSPRLIVWLGKEGDAAAARERLYPALARLAEVRGYPVDAGVLSAKLSFAYRTVLDRAVTGLRLFGARLAVIGLQSPEDVRDGGFGAGTLFDVTLPDLDALRPHLRPKDQTLIHFGLGSAELAAFAARLNGRGLARLVPAGQALAFDALWDGADLLSAMTKLVTVEAPE